MVQGMHKVIVSFSSAQNLNGSVGDDLVDIHIRGSACSSLKSADNKFPVKFSAANFFAGFNNGLGLLLRQLPQTAINQSCGLLNQGHFINQPQIDAFASQVKVFRSPLGVDSIILNFRYPPLTQGILFNSKVHLIPSTGAPGT